MNTKAIMALVGVLSANVFVGGFLAVAVGYQSYEAKQAVCAEFAKPPGQADVAKVKNEINRVRHDLKLRRAAKAVDAGSSLPSDIFNGVDPTDPASLDRSTAEIKRRTEALKANLVTVYNRCGIPTERLGQ